MRGGRVIGGGFGFGGLARRLPFSKICAMTFRARVFMFRQSMGGL
jgi:hypothetical protein